MKQLKLVEVEPTPVKPPRPPAETTGVPVYGKYRPKNPVKCDDCMLLLVQMRGLAPLARQARFYRRAGGQKRLLCAGHKNQWLERDKLPKSRIR